MIETRLRVSEQERDPRPDNILNMEQEQERDRDPIPPQWIPRLYINNHPSLCQVAPGLTRNADVGMKSPFPPARSV